MLRESLKGPIIGYGQARGIDDDATFWINCVVQKKIESDIPGINVNYGYAPYGAAWAVAASCERIPKSLENRRDPERHRKLALRRLDKFDAAWANHEKRVKAGVVYNRETGKVQLAKKP